MCFFYSDIRVLSLDKLPCDLGSAENKFERQIARRICWSGRGAAPRMQIKCLAKQQRQLSVPVGL